MMHDTRECPVLRWIACRVGSIVPCRERLLCAILAVLLGIVVRMCGCMLVWMHDCVDAWAKKKPRSPSCRSAACEALEVVYRIIAAIDNPIETPIAVDRRTINMKFPTAWQALLYFLPIVSPS